MTYLNYPHKYIVIEGTKLNNFNLQITFNYLSMDGDSKTIEICDDNLISSLSPFEY